MILYIQENQSEYIQPIANAYDNVIKKFPELDKLNIKVNGKLELEVPENVRVYEGTDKDSGTYIMSIKFIDNSLEEIIKSFNIGLATIYVQYTEKKVSKRTIDKILDKILK